METSRSPLQSRAGVWKRDVGDECRRGIEIQLKSKKAEDRTQG